MYSPSSIQKGKEGEGMVMWGFNKYGLNVSGNNLNEGYTQQKGIDIWNIKSKFYCEVKNNNGKYSLDEKWLEDQKVLEKFPKNGIHILALAHDTTTKRVKAILESRGIMILEWGEQLTGQSWKKALSNVFKFLRRIHWKLKRYLVKAVSNISSVITTNIQYNTIKLREYIELKDTTDYIQHFSDRLILIDTKYWPDPATPDRPLGVHTSWGEVGQ